MILNLLLTAFLAVVANVDPKLEATSRAVVVNLIAGHFDEVTKSFNDDFRHVATPQLLAGIKADINSQMGAFHGIRSVRQLLEEGHQIIEVTCDFEKNPVVFRVVFDGRGYVGSVFANPYVPLKIDPALDAVAQELFRNFEADQYDLLARRFDVAMRKQLTRAKFEQVRTAVYQQFGSFRSMISVHQEIEGEYRVVTAVAQYETVPVEMRVTFNGDGEISGLRIGPKVNAGAPR
jgi:hypothetical protein